MQILDTYKQQISRRKKTFIFLLIESVLILEKNVKTPCCARKKKLTLKHTVHAAYIKYFVKLRENYSNIIDFEQLMVAFRVFMDPTI